MLLTPIAARERRIPSEAPCWVPTFINTLRLGVLPGACIVREPAECPEIGISEANPAWLLTPHTNAAPPRHAERENSLRSMEDSYLSISVGDKASEATDTITVSISRFCSIYFHCINVTIFDLNRNSGQ